MKKLTMLFAATALVATLGLAGCKKKDEAKANDTAAQKATEAPATAPAATPTTAPAAAGGPATAAAPAAEGNLPVECNDYKAAIEKLASCDKLPQPVRDGLKQAYDQVSAGWPKVPAESKASLAGPCKGGLDAVTAAAKQTCGW
jgi:hypothetical protein